MEDLEVLQTLASGSEQDRLAGHGCHGQRGAAAGVAIELGEHHAGEVHAFIECLGGLDRVLTDHRVDDEQDFIGLHGVTDIACLLHQLLVHAQATGGIDDHRVIKLLLGEFDGIACHLHRVTGSLARSGHSLAAVGLHALLGGVDGYAGTFADHLQLGHCVRTLQIGRHQQRCVAGVLEPVAKLAGQRGFTGTLKTCEHDDRRRVLGEVQRAVHALTEHVGELLIDDLHHLLGRVERIGHLGAQRAFAHLAGKGTHHVERHIGVEQRAADCLNAFESLSVKELNAAIMGNSLAATREILFAGQRFCRPYWRCVAMVPFGCRRWRNRRQTSSRRVSYHSLGAKPIECFRYHRKCKESCVFWNAYAVLKIPGHRLYADCRAPSRT